MNRIVSILLLLILGCSCTSSDEKHLKLLMDDLKVETSNGSSPNVVIIILEMKNGYHNVVSF